ncbi:MAG: photosynthetic reaction center subunit H [Hyphomicrobiaceae bacterium]|nr:photosynthetic reaction center subunit H [Hyphomicrobiaceae bacterium]
MGEITGTLDVAQVVLYVFWIFFAGLIFYLRREDRREGYPLYSEPANAFKDDSGLIFIPPPKVFRLPHGGEVSAPSGKYDDREPHARKVAPWPGAPLEPIGDPMLAGVGPGSFAERQDAPDKMIDGSPRIKPMRAAPGFSLAAREPDPRGMTVVGADGIAAGSVTDAWVDRMEVVIRYLEVELAAKSGDAGTKQHVLLPMNFARVDRRRGIVSVHALMSRHFAMVPKLATAEQVTLLEEDKITAFYGAGTLYADPKRTEAWI